MAEKEESEDESCNVLMVAFRVDVLSHTVCLGLRRRRKRFNLPMSKVTRFSSSSPINISTVVDLSDTSTRTISEWFPCCVMLLVNVFVNSLCSVCSG